MAVKLSLNAKLRFVISLIGMMFIITLIAGFFSSTVIVENMKKLNADQKIVDFSKRLGIMLFVAGGVGELLTVITYLILSKRGTMNYKRIIDSLDTSDARSFNLKVSFPDEDEFGDLGKHLNKLMFTLQQFDKIKTDRLQVCRKEVQNIADLIELPIVLTDAEGKITLMNQRFKEEIALNKQVEGFKISSLIENAEAMMEDVNSAGKEKEFEDVKGTQASGFSKAEIKVFPFRDSAGNTFEYLWIIKNEKKRKK